MSETRTNLYIVNLNPPYHYVNNCTFSIVSFVGQQRTCNLTIIPKVANKRKSGRRRLTFFFSVKFVDISRLSRDRFIRRLLVHSWFTWIFCTKTNENLNKIKRRAKQHQLVATRTMQEFRMFRQPKWKNYRPVGKKSCNSLVQP